MKQNTVYDALAMSPFTGQVAKIRDAALKSFTLGDGLFQQIGNDTTTLYKVVPGTDTETIPQFNLPLTVHNGREFATVIDTRPFERANGQTTKAYEISNMVIRAVCENEWTNSQEDYEGLSAVLAGVYGEWITQGIRSAYKLDPATEAIYNIAFTYYCWHRINVFGKKGIEVEDVVVWFTKFASRNFKHITPQSVDIFFSNIDGNEHVADSSATLETILQYTNHVADNPAIHLDTAGVIGYVIQRSWFGFADKEIVGSAIEHPPMLTYMVYGALTQSIYRRTLVGGAVEAMSRRRLKMDSLTRWMQGVMDDNGLSKH